MWVRHCTPHLEFERRHRFAEVIALEQRKSHLPADLNCRCVIQAFRQSGDALIRGHLHEGLHERAMGACGVLQLQQQGAVEFEIVRRDDAEFPQARLASLVIEHDVEIREIPLAKPDEKPLIVRGDRVKMDQPVRDQAVVKLRGVVVRGRHLSRP